MPHRSTSKNTELLAPAGSIEHFHAAVEAGAAQIALRTGAPLLPVFVIREPDNGLQLRIEPPLDLERSGDPQEELQRAVQQIARCLEPIIRDHPDQWIVRDSPWAQEPA